MSLRINFEFDRSDILPSQFTTMKKVAEILNTYPSSKVWISGHTDSIGTNVYNMGLSMRRMGSVQQYLSGHGVNGSRFFMPVPYGEDRPVATNGNTEGRRRNRRVDFTIFTSDQNPEIPEGSLVRDVEAFNDSTFTIFCNGKVPFELDDYSNPPRISVDLPGVYYLRETMSKDTFELNRGLVNRARVAYHEEGYTRVVFDLKRPTKYSARLVDDAVVVTISTSGVPPQSEMTRKQ
ncbi:MAG: AMIN domain-containing protein [Calditrichaeota bacterium]|nr:MAG: AMIN domain-containing protein [Calditrichota bacterium]